MNTRIKNKHIYYTDRKYCYQNSLKKYEAYGVPMFSQKNVYAKFRADDFSQGALPV